MLEATCMDCAHFDYKVEYDDYGHEMYFPVCLANCEMTNPEPRKEFDKLGGD